MTACNDFQIGEGVTLQFRSESFNGLQPHELEWAEHESGAGTFGQITSAKDPRAGQLALKLRF